MTNSIPNSHVKRIHNAIIAKLERAIAGWQRADHDRYLGYTYPNHPEYIKGRIDAYRHVIKLLGGSS